MPMSSNPVAQQSHKTFVQAAVENLGWTVPFRRQSEPHRPDRRLRRDHILHLRCERIPDVRQGPLSSGRTLRPTSGSL